jgi:hypothetical protein
LPFASRNGFIAGNKAMTPILLSGLTPRRIRLLVCALAALAAPVVPAADSPARESRGSRDSLDEGQAIFNGRDLRGWKGDTNHWSVEDGAIVGRTTAERPTKENTFLLWTNGMVNDFELRLKCKITADNAKGSANSGIQYRSRHLTNEAAPFVVAGYQADFEAGKTYSGMLHEERGRGILAERGQVTRIGSTGKVHPVGSVGGSAELQALLRADNWNDYLIVARGNHLQHFINGRLFVDVTDDHEGARALHGILALQLHSGEPMTVRFKEIRFKSVRP